MVDEPVGERRAAQRVQARAHHGADLAGVELQRVDGPDRVPQQLLLDPRGTALQAVRHEVIAQVEVAALHPAALEDALGERVALQPQQVQNLLLGVGGAGIGDREPGDPRAEAPGRGGVPAQRG